MKKRISLFAESHIPFQEIAYAIFCPLPPRCLFLISVDVFLLH